MSTEERLRQLQMADLGSSRREYISTVDDPKKRSRVRLEELEATRESNVAGTAAARQATENKALLSQWANLHKTIGDTQGLEDLDDLMSGQSHRANLNAVMQAAGGQRPRSGQAKSHSGAKGNHPFPAASSGRGGGVIGTRGRGGFSPSKAGKHERRAVTQRHDMPPLSRLDPALDVNNPGDSQRGPSGHRGHGKRRREEPAVREKKGVPAVRAKRPMIDFSRNLSTPEAFLAAARQNLGVGLAAPNPSSSTNPVLALPAGQRPEPPNPLGHPKPKTAVPPGHGLSPIPKVTGTTVSGRPAPKAAAPSTTGVTNTPVSSRPISTAAGPSIPGVTGRSVDRDSIFKALVDRGPVFKALASSTAGATNLSVNRRPSFPAPTLSTPKITNTPVMRGSAPMGFETPSPPAREPHIYDATTRTSGPAPVSQRIPAEIKTGKVGTPVRSTTPTPASESKFKTECVPGIDLPKPSKDIEKNNSANLLLDVDELPEASQPNLQQQVMSPGCAELTGLDFPSEKKSRVVSPPSTPLAQSTTQTPTPVTRSELWASLNKLVETSRLSQQLIDTVHSARDVFLQDVFNAVVAGGIQGQELAAENANIPQPSSMGRSLVEDWLSRTPADQVLSPDRAALEQAKSSFEMYRSPANTASSSGSAQKESPDSLTPGLSPRKTTASEGIFGLEALRLSDEPPRASDTASRNNAIQKRAAESLAQSIHAGPSLGSYNPERAKVFEPESTHSKEHQAPTPFASFAPRSHPLQFGQVPNTAPPTEGSEPATHRGPAPAFPPGLNPFAPIIPLTRADAAAEPSTRQSTGPKIIGPPPYDPNATRLKVIGPPPYQPKPTGPKIIGPPPYQPKPAGPKIIGPPPYQPKPAGPKIIGVSPFMPNYPVARPSTDTARPDTNRAALPRTPSMPAVTQSQQNPSPRIIGPKPYTPIRNPSAGTTTAEPLSSAGSNVRKETTTASPSAGSRYRPSPLSQYLSESIWAQEPPKVTADTSRQATTQNSVHASHTENKAPQSKVRIIGPQPYIPKD